MRTAGVVAGAAVMAAFVWAAANLPAWFAIGCWFYCR